MNLQRIPKFLLNFPGKLWSSLTEPLEALERIGDYRRAVTISAFLLFAVISITLERIEDNNTPVSALILLMVGYILARSRWFKISALILIFTLTFPSYLAALKLPNPDPSQVVATFAWLIVPLLLSSLIYSVQVTIAIGVLNFLVLAALPFLRPELSFQIIDETLEFYGSVTAIVVIVMVQRNQIENDRQKEQRYERRFAGGLTEPIAACCSLRTHVPPPSPNTPAFFGRNSRGA